MTRPKNTPDQRSAGDGGTGHNVLDTIRQIKAGTFDPKSLSIEDRRSCVMHLGAEGVSVPEMAKLLRVSERTIRLDRKANREAAAIEPDPKLAGQMAGLMVQEAESSVTRIRRITRDPETPPAVKVDAEYRCFDIYDRVTARLQSLGFLPSAAQRIEADLTHHSGEGMTLQEIQAEARRLEQVQQRFDDHTPPDPAPSEASGTPATPQNRQLKGEHP